MRRISILSREGILRSLTGRTGTGPAGNILPLNPEEEIQCRELLERTPPSASTIIGLYHTGYVHL